MAVGKTSQRGASRNGRSTSAKKRAGTGRRSAHTRAPAGGSSSPRRARATAASSRSASKPGSSSRGRNPSRAGATRAPARRPQQGASSWVPLTVVAIVLLLGWAMYPAIQVQYQATRQYEGLQAEYRGLKERNAVLRAEVADLKTPQGVERAARESLGFAKRGENVYVVLPPGAEASATPGADTSAAVEADAAMRQGQPDPITALLDLLFGVHR